MLRILSIATILFLCTEAIGQQAFDIVYLRNGSIIKGNIIENTLSGLKVETCCGSVFSFKPDEVLRIERDQGEYPHLYEKGRKDNIENADEISVIEPFHRSGSMVTFSSGILLGSFWNNKQAILSTLVEYNYRFMPYFATGATVGYEVLNESTIPIAVNIKALYPVKRHELFIGFSCGYNCSVEKLDMYIYTHHSGGILLNAEAGARFQLSQNNSFFIAAGYRYNELHYKVNDWWLDTFKRTIYFNRFSFRIGFVLL